MPRLHTRAALLASLALTLACSHDTTGLGPNDVAGHRRKWEAQDITSYTFQFQRHAAQYILEPALVEVRAGAVFRATSLTTGQQLAANVAREYPTIPQEFDQLQSIVNAGGDGLEVSWDDTLGYPTRVSSRSDVFDTNFTDQISAVHRISPGS